MPTGLTAALTVSFTGASASAYGQEVDLAIDAAGDLLQIDAAGDGLIASPSIMTFTGTTAAALVSGPPETLEGEGWAGFQTETGQTIDTEAGQ